MCDRCVWFKGYCRCEDFTEYEWDTLDVWDCPHYEEDFGDDEEEINAYYKHAEELHDQRRDEGLYQY